MYPVFNSSGSAASFGDEPDFSRSAKQQIIAVGSPQNVAASMKPKPNRQVILQRVKCEFPELEAAEALLEMGCSAKILITNSSFYDKNHHTNTTTTTTTIATVNLPPGCTSATSNGVSCVTSATNGTTSPVNDSNSAKRRKLHPETNGTTPVPLNLDSSNTNATTNTKKTITTNATNGVAPDGSLAGDHLEDIENSLDDKSLASFPEVSQTASRVTFPPRSDEEKLRMRNNLIEFLTEEDIRYLRVIHERHQKSVDFKYHMPFGSDAVNKSHLGLDNKETMIDEQETTTEQNQHPKWWRGCSRCNVIELDEEKTPVDHGMSYSDLKELVRSHIEQLAVMRGDQRVLPPGPVMKKHEIVEFVKTFTLRYLDRRFRRLKRVRKNTATNNTTAMTKMTTTAMEIAR